MSHLRGPYAALVTAAFLYGITFVLIKDAVSTFPPLTFVGWRFLVGGLALALLSFPTRSDVWRDGAVAGLLLFAGFAFQTAGLVTTDATNSALITGLYVVFTPVIVGVARRRVPSPWVSVGVVIAFVGIALLTIGDRVLLGTGDLLTLGCAVAFAGHIAYLSVTAHRHAVIPFTSVQLLVTAALGLASSVLFEGATLPGRTDWPPILLTGLGVSAAGFLLQVWAQTRVGPARTAIVLALEPVFGVAAAAILIGERLTLRGWVGALTIMGAIWMVLTRDGEPETVEAEAVAPGW